jgi:hypothetical protein
VVQQAGFLGAIGLQGIQQAEHFAAGICAARSCPAARHG